MIIDNLTKYYRSDQANKQQAADIEVIPKEQADQIDFTPSPGPEEAKLLSARNIIIGIVMFFIAVDIPIGLKLVQQSQQTTSSAAPQVTKPREISPTGFAPKPTQVTPSPRAATATPVSSATPSATPTSKPASQISFNQQDLSYLLIETHAECTPTGMCVEIEGPGEDKCIIDSDCKQPSSLIGRTLADKRLGGSANTTGTVLGEVAQVLATPTLRQPSPTAATPTTIPAPDTPNAGSLTATLLGILAGLALIGSVIFL